MPKSTRNSVILCALLLVFATPQIALAYIDPGSGSFLFQSLLGIVIGAGFAIKLSWQTIKRFMRQRVLGRDGD